MKNMTKTNNTSGIENYDEIVADITQSCFTEVFSKIKAIVGETLKDGIRNDTIKRIRTPSGNLKLVRQLKISATDNQDGSFSTKKEEDMNINIPGISINSKPRSDGRYQGYIIEGGTKKYVYGRSTDEVICKIKLIMKNGLNKKNAKKDGTPTLKEWAEKWVKLYKEPNLKPKSLENLRYSLKKIYAGFENTRLSGIKTTDVQEYFLSLEGTRSRDLALCVMNEMLEKARKQGVIKTNPCEGVEIKKHAQKKKKGLMPEEQKILLEAVKGLTVEPIFVLLLTGGFRIGELLALTSDDVDFEKNTVSINKDVVFIKGKRIVQTTKTEAGVRTVPLPDNSMEYLKGRTGILFNVCYNSVRLAFCRLAKKTGIDVTPHILRHTYSDRLEEAGIPPKVKQYLLGHSKLDITQNTYTDTQSHYVNKFVDQITGAF